MEVGGGGDNLCKVRLYWIQDSPKGIGTTTGVMFVVAKHFERKHRGAWQPYPQEASYTLFFAEPI